MPHSLIVDSFHTLALGDDPSGIATYSQAGAQFGFNTLWTLVLTYPFMVGIQLVSARIGRVTGRGLAANIRRAYPPWLLYVVVLLLLVANVINIAADIAAMGEALRLVTGVGSQHMYSLGFGILCLLLQVFLPYSTYVRYLKWLTLGLLAELQSRTYHESQNKPTYVIREIREQLTVAPGPRELHRA